MISKLQFEIVFHEHRQTVLQKRADLTAIRSMPIAHGEEMTMFESHDVRICNIGVLVHLIGVVCRNSSFRRERELCDYVHYF